MLSTVRSFSLDGINAQPMRVEVDVHRGLPGFAIAGMPEGAVRESRERVRAAIINAGFAFPLVRIVVDLAPASLRRAGPGLDLAIAAGILLASGQIESGRLGDAAIVGELWLDGSLRSVAGAVAMAERAAVDGVSAIVVPEVNAAEAALVDGVRAIGLARLAALPAALVGELPEASPLGIGTDGTEPDLADLRGMHELRHMLEVAAAGGHDMLMVGSGASLAAARMPSILPPLSPGEALEIAKIASACERLHPGAAIQRPFRAPHHTISLAGLLGGGDPLRPGEVTLAHLGVLFLDQLTQFRGDALESLRRALATGEARLCTAASERGLPARPQLLASVPACPCGVVGSEIDCECPPDARECYRARLLRIGASFDLICPVSVPSLREIAASPGESSAEVRARVVAARQRAASRLGDGRTNATMSAAEVRACGVDRKASLLISRNADGAALDPAVRIARTLADLEGAELVGGEHIAQALGVRSAARL
jgi:magnesium chelatase family protein